MQGRFGAVAAAVALALLVGCGAKAKLKTETKQSGATLDVTVSVDPPASGTLTFKGHPAFEKLGPQQVSMNQTLALSVPVAGMPAGKNTVAMHFEGQGKGLAKKVVADSTLAFDRKAATPEPRFGASASKAGAAMLPCSGSPCMGTSLPFVDGKLYVDITHCNGCTLDFGGDKIAVTSDPFPAAIDMGHAVATVSVAGLNGISDTKIPFQVTQGSDAGEQAIEGKPPALLSPILVRVAHGGLAFVGETPAPSTAPKAAVVVRRDDGLYFRVVGSPSTMKDVDLIGVATVSDKPLGTCGIYESTTSKTKVNVAHKGESYDITMYDRRSGKSLGHRSFPYVDKGCADTVYAKVVTSTPHDETIVAWAKTFLR